MNAYACIRAVNSDDDQAIFTLVEKLSGLAAGWKNLGLELGILIDKLDEIGAVVVEDSSVIKLQKTLQYWKDNGAREKRTWGFLADAASKAGNHALALEIRDRRDYSENAEGQYLERQYRNSNACSYEVYVSFTLSLFALNIIPLGLPY